MYEDSFGCLWACTYSGNTDLAVIKISAIQSVISMQPLPQAKGNPDGLFFVVENLGLDDNKMKGYAPEDLVQMQDQKQLYNNTAFIGSIDLGTALDIRFGCHVIYLLWSL
jgi:hypothetical protein